MGPSHFSSQKGPDKFMAWAAHPFTGGILTIERVLLSLSWPLYPQVHALHSSIVTDYNECSSRKVKEQRLLCDFPLKKKKKNEREDFCVTCMISNTK